MKVVLIYSGKGGVGKSTTTSNIAKSLSKNNKVYVFDGDVNTPSLNRIFGKENVSKNLKVNSMGFKTKNLIYLEKSFLRKHIAEAIDEINVFKPDYVLIDTPPSLTDVHINLIEKFKVSGIIMVTQPQELSIQDVDRTSAFFINRNINILGIVENMSNSNDNKYNWKLLSRIPFVDSFNIEDIYKKYKDNYDKIAQDLENIEDVILENKINQYTNEDIKIEEEDLRKYRKFINLKTWNRIREQLIEGGLYTGQVDRFLQECTTERIERLLNAFKNDNNAYFMITNAPNTEIDLITGEIGECSLVIDDKNYGVPKVKYKTSRGEVTLFPYEVKPANQREIQDCLDERGRITKDGRYLPNKKIIREIYFTFGTRVGLTEDWEKKYNLITNDVSNLKFAISREGER